MAVTTHPTGGYRAYKKINGFEHQYYFRRLSDAERKQRDLEALASLKPSVKFAKCGRLHGIRIYCRARKGRRKYVFASVQISPYPKRELLYSGCFEDFWKDILRTWRECRSLTSADIAGYSKELRVAKRLYLSDFSEADEKLDQRDAKKIPTLPALGAAPAQR